MLKKFTFLFALLFLCACGTTQKKSSDAVDEEFGWIENSDFIPEKEVPYKPEMDQFSSEISDYDSLTKESIARVPEKKLDVLNRNDKSPISQAVGFCYQGDYQSAFRVLDQNYEKYKSHPSYWNQMGTCYLLQGERNKALLYYNKSRGVSDDYVPAINNIGVIYEREGFDQKALKTFQEASKRDSFSLTPVFNLSQLYLKYGFSRKARRLLSGLYQKNDRDIDVLTGIATSYLLEGKPKKAITYFHKIPREHHGRPDIGLNFSVALKMIDRDGDAQTIFREVRQNQLGPLKAYYEDVKDYVR